MPEKPLFQTTENQEAAEQIISGGKPKQAQLSSRAPKPVATLTGQELMNFTGPQDMPALRKAAQAWYGANLVGTTATMLDGTVVHFNKIGMRESTFGRKGDTLLRSVPAIRAIVENGTVIVRVAGNQPHILERLVISAPVEFMGQIKYLAVPVHKMKDGTFQYSFNVDRDASGPGVGVPGGLMPAKGMEVGLEGAANGAILFEVSGKFKAPAPKPRVSVPSQNPYRFVITRKQRAELTAEIRDIARRLLGRQLVDVAFTDNLGEGEDAFFDPNTGIIHVALQGMQNPRSTVRHEAIHALRQAGVITAREWAVLSRMAQTRWIEQYSIRERYEALYRERFDIRPEQLEELIIEEAVADAMADHWAKPPAEDVVSRIFSRVKTFLEAVRNMLRGRGFTTADQILSNIERGGMGERQAGRGRGGISCSMPGRPIRHRSPPEADSARRGTRTRARSKPRTTSVCAGLSSTRPTCC